MGEGVAASKRFYDAKQFLEAWSIGLIPYWHTVRCLQRVFNDQRPNTKIHNMVQEVYKRTITVEVAAYALEAAYESGGKTLV